VITSNAGRNLQKFAERAHIPIAFTLHGLSAIPVDHPLSLGMVGMHGTVEANRALLNTDLIISFGMRFDDRVTGNLKLFGGDAKVIHVEIDPSEIDKNVKTSIAINADTGQALNIFANDHELINKPRRLWFEQIDVYRSEIREATQAEIDNGLGTEGELLMKTIATRLSDITGGKDIIVADVGQHQMIMARYYNYQTPNSWFTSGGAGTMGCSLPMALGVKLARPDERVWSISGDGGFQMNIQELGMVRQWQTLFYDGRYAGTPMKNPDFEAISGAYGIPYLKVDQLDQIDDAIKTAADHKGAFMVEFLCDPSEIILPMVPAGGGIADMIVSRRT
jgi:acetolactate synthase-1/2/3 large subunit